MNRTIPILIVTVIVLAAAGTGINWAVHKHRVDLYGSTSVETPKDPASASQYATERVPSDARVVMVTRSGASDHETIRALLNVTGPDGRYAYVLSVERAGQLLCSSSGTVPSLGYRAGSFITALSFNCTSDNLSNSTLIVRFPDTDTAQTSAAWSMDWGQPVPAP